MRLLRCLPILLFLGVGPWLRAEVADLGFGTIDLPPGVEHHTKQGLDSALGTFVGPVGTPAVSYDIGGYLPTTVPKRKLLFLRRGVVHGFAWFAFVARAEPHALCVTFPKAGPACFGADFTTRSQRDKALHLILRYTPKRDLFASPTTPDLMR